MNFQTDRLPTKSSARETGCSSRDSDYHNRSILWFYTFTSVSMDFPFYYGRLPSTTWSQLTTYLLQNLIIFVRARRKVDHQHGMFLPIFDSHCSMTWSYALFRLFTALQQFGDELILPENMTIVTFAQDNYALQIQAINLESLREEGRNISGQVFFADLGGIDDIVNITDDRLVIVTDESEVVNQPTASVSLPASVLTAASIISNQTTELRICYTVFVNSVLFQLRTTSSLAEQFEGFEDGSVITSTRVGSGAPPENLSTPIKFVFQKSLVRFFITISIY